VTKYGIFSGGYEGRRKADVDLGERYRDIGISAVAAAVRYQGPSKNATDTSQNHDQDAIEKAA